MDQNRMVTNGHDLVDALDTKGMPIGAAMWVHNTDVDTWKLWIVPRRQTDKREFYRKVAETISGERSRFSELDASDTEFMLPSHPAIKALNRFSRVSGRGSIHLRNNMLDGYYMTDGIILLMDL